jgi:hypothetical protein
VNPAPWDEPTSAPSAVIVRGVTVRVGDQVRLRLHRRADIMDMVLDGKLATVAAIEQDFEGRVHFAVTVDDDPGRDLGTEKMVGHRFFFLADEVEPMF